MAEAKKTLRRPHSVLLYGPPGTGKTWSLRTIPGPLFVIFTDAHGPASLEKAFAGKIPEHVHWHVLQDEIPLDEALKGLSAAGLGNKSEEGKFWGQRAYLNFIGLLKNFTCQRTGKSFGPISKFSAEATLVLDNMTGLTDIILLGLGGFGADLPIQKWGQAATTTVNIIQTLLKFPGLFVCIAHATREADEVSQLRLISPDFVGAKLPVRVAKYFGDTVYATRNGTTFLWSTVAPNTQTVPRLLPMSEALEPSFKPFFE